MTLSDAQIDRYSRQIVLPEIGGAGQQRLLTARVAVAGAGELAATVVRYLAGAGVGHLALYGASRALVDELHDLNPDVAVTLSPRFSTDAQADVAVAADVARADLDAIATTPLIVAGVAGSEGWLAVVEPGACTQCPARQAAASLDGTPAAATPLHGPAVGVVGALTAMAVVERLLGLAPAASDGPPGARAAKWLHFDAMTSSVREHVTARAADCPVCGAA